MEFDLVMQPKFEHVYYCLGESFFRTTSGLVYICECYEINGNLTVITECLKLPHGGNFWHSERSLRVTKLGVRGAIRFLLYEVFYVRFWAFCFSVILSYKSDYMSSSKLSVKSNSRLLWSYNSMLHDYCNSDISISQDLSAKTMSHSFAVIRDTAFATRTENSFFLRHRVISSI